MNWFDFSGLRSKVPSHLVNVISQPWGNFFKLGPNSHLEWQGNWLEYASEHTCIQTAASVVCGGMHLQCSNSSLLSSQQTLNKGIAVAASGVQWQCMYVYVTQWPTETQQKEWNWESRCRETVTNGAQSLRLGKQRAAWINVRLWMYTWSRIHLSA